MIIESLYVYNGSVGGWKYVYFLAEATAEQSNKDSLYSTTPVCGS